MARPLGPAARIASFLLVGIGAWLLVGATVLWWADRQVLDGDRVAATMTDLLQRPAVQTALVQGITDQLPIDPALREQVKPVVAQVVATDRFAVLYEQAVRAAHAQLVDGDGEVVVLDLSTVLQEVKAVVATQSPEAAAAIPDAPLQLEVIERSELPGVWRGVTKADRLVLPLVLLGAGAILLGAALAPRWWVPLAVTAFVAAGVAYAVVLTVRVVVDRVEESVRDPQLSTAAHEVLSAATDGLSEQSGRLAVMAVVAGVVVTAVGLGTDLARRRARSA